MKFYGDYRMRFKYEMMKKNGGGEKEKKKKKKKKIEKSN